MTLFSTWIIAPPKLRIEVTEKDLVYPAFLRADRLGPCGARGAPGKVPLRAGAKLSQGGAAQMPRSGGGEGRPGMARAGWGRVGGRWWGLVLFGVLCVFVVCFFGERGGGVGGQKPNSRAHSFSGCLFFWRGDPENEL